MTDEVKHTPGPWKYKFYGRKNSVDVFSGKGEERKFICQVGYVQDELYRAHRDDGKSNLYLIAAAPDLLEACEWALLLIENGNFKNGVLDQTETIDEGEVKARQIYDQIRLTVAKAKGEA